MRKSALSLAAATALGLAGSVTAAPELEVGGRIEVEATRGEETSDIAVATAELGFTAQVNDKVSGQMVLLHEADEPDPVVVDIAAVNIAFSENFGVIAGKSFIPFGLLESNMISDPLTLEFAETGATLLQADIISGPMLTSLYSFNGTNATDEAIDNWGASFGYASEQFTVTLGYLANIGDSDGVAAETINSEVAGISVSAAINLARFSLIAEHIRANDEFEVGDGNADYQFSSQAQPSATNIELAYTMNATTFAIGIQGTDEAEDLGLPENRAIIAICHELMEETFIALEYANDEDYAGKESDSVTAQLAIEF